MDEKEHEKNMALIVINLFSQALKRYIDTELFTAILLEGAFAVTFAFAAVKMHSTGVCILYQHVSRTRMTTIPATWYKLAGKFTCSLHSDWRAHTCCAGG